MKIDNLRRRFGAFLLGVHLLSGPILTMGIDSYRAPEPQPQIVETVEAEPVLISNDILVEEEPVVEPEPETLTVVTTAYCAENFPHICNNGDASTTSTGTTPTPGRTIAVDPSVIPYGCEVIIDGHTYVAEDCGGAIKGNRIDILFATHDEALSWGKRTKEVIIRN